MRKTFHAKEGLEFTNRGTIAQQEPDLSSRFELKKEHHERMGSGSITGPNATLIFEVELIAIK